MTGSQGHITFDPFRLDIANECLWRGDQFVPLRPKSFALLRYLLEHSGRLLTKEELLNAIWPGTYVTDTVLKVCIREIREALDDDPKAPRFIETVHRRGYRFIAKTQDPRPKTQDLRPQTQEPGFQSAIRHPPSAIQLVGRGKELSRLDGWFEKALGRERHIGFITGEPGIGKTTLVDAFLEQAVGRGAWTARGQCVEHFGVDEAYMPVLDALGRFLREPGRGPLVALLRRHAPTWLAQMPWLSSPDEREALHREVLGATRERMLREIAEALEALTAETPLVFVLEDLHWSDFSTLDFISSLARRRELARLLLIGTYRPADVIITGHPLKIVRQELQLHGDCEELPLGALDPGDVAEYLATRFAGGVPEGLARMVHHRTEGHPLFMVNVVDYLVEHGGLVEADGRWVLREDVGDVVVGVPETIKQLVERQVDRLDSEEQRVLHGASVAGVEFSVAAVAAGLGADSFAVEERCEKLARQRQFLRPSGAAAMTNGTVTARYGFIHSLYQEVLYEQMSAVRRTQLHRRIGEHEEAVLGDQAADMSTELAMHFERGWDYQRAVKYLDQAAENATRRFANHEAAALARRGLELIGKWPDGLDRTRQELKLQLTLGFSLSVIKGYADPETGASMARARELSRQLGEDPQLFRVIFGLWQFYYVRADRQEARPLAEQLLRMAQQVRDPVLLMGAHFAMGNILGSLGETDLSLQHYEQAVALHDPDRRAEYHRLYRMDPGIYSRCHTVRALWVRGYPDTARRRVEEALELARHSDPRSLAFALVIAVSTYWLNREAQRVRELSEWGLEHCAKYGIAQERVWLAAGHGWALAEQGQVEVGLAEMRQSLEAIRAMHSEIAAPAILTILAEMLQKAGRIEEGLATVAEAMEVIERAGARSYKPELYRLKGELLLHCGWRMADGGLKEADIRSDRQLGIQGQEAEPDASNPQSAIRNPQSEAEACFHQAIELARQMQGKAWELRAQISLSRLWLEQGKTEEARERLAAICGQFSEGPDTADLREARALLGA